MSSLAEYLEYNEYFQKYINILPHQRKKNNFVEFTVSNVNSFKPGIEGFGGIL